MNMLMIYIIGFVLTLALALVLTPLVKKFAFFIGAVDKPNARKVHTTIMPRLGGLGIFIAVMAALFAVLPFIPDNVLSVRDENFVKAFVVGGTMIMLLGALDDRFQLNAKLKFLVQIATACVVVFGFDIRIEFANIPFHSYSSIESWIAIPFTLLWIVGVTNAINLIDGLDGLAAGVSAIAIGTIAVMSFIMGNEIIAVICMLLLGSILGFLYFNFHPAKIFMGDSGALFLGFSLALLSLLGFKQVAIVSFLTPLILIGVPLSDTMFAIVRRWMQKKPIFSPDKGHLHHCLRELGFSHRQTVLIIYGIAAFFGVLAIIQSSAALYSANWVTFVVICIMAFFLQIGAEVIGLIGKTKRPLLNFLMRLRLKVTAARESK